jgi:hypothetical protein
MIVDFGSDLDIPITKDIIGAWRDQVINTIAHPPHYTAGRSIEPIDAIVDWDLSYCLGNVVKYVSRAGRKGPPVEDLKKALFYLQREIELLEGGAK